ncbi:acetolactate synthase small subunit [Megasphaera cerevisiae]|jgi:acetolactate synthase-1/3 small subunit|uniref:acetolactate synthase small subunit n=1 Tax=Megasphaera cerevisiae TaxID=39029 RepID=UPI0009426F0A|nr:acetolactate synthase small subunit [Megasphaera cerevisiae]MCI1750486.1 acetolactate synthase small subunit [Megasphaera cerevisiae]OKY52480.1 acetolactate synthase small subunit [Megasphaera cerevisiae]
MRRQHLAILSDNKPGVLTHIAGLISRKAINIESLTAGYTEEPDVTRFNIVISIEDDKELKQTIKQLAKLIDVIKIVNLDEDLFVSCELAMIKIQYGTPRIREELANIAALFHAQIVDVNLGSLIMRIMGREDHVEALLHVLTPYQVLEIARTGPISLSRGMIPVKAM